MKLSWLLHFHDVIWSNCPHQSGTSIWHLHLTEHICEWACPYAAVRPSDRLFICQLARPFANIALHPQMHYRVAGDILAMSNSLTESFLVRPEANQLGGPGGGVAPPSQSYICVTSFQIHQSTYKSSQQFIWSTKNTWSLWIYSKINENHVWYKLPSLFHFQERCSFAVLISKVWDFVGVYIR